MRYLCIVLPGLVHCLLCFMFSCMKEQLLLVMMLNQLVVCLFSFGFICSLNLRIFFYSLPTNILRVCFVGYIILHVDLFKKFFCGILRYWIILVSVSVLFCCIVLIWRLCFLLLCFQFIMASFVEFGDFFFTLFFIVACLYFTNVSIFPNCIYRFFICFGLFCRYWESKHSKAIYMLS